MGKMSRVEYLYEKVFTPTYNKGVKRGQLRELKKSNIPNIDSVKVSKNEYCDPMLFDFLNKLDILNNYIGEDNTSKSIIFNWLKDCDPTEHKENLNWLIKLYKKQLVSIGQHNEYLGSGMDYPQDIITFYEDLYTTVKSSLHTLSILKKTNVLDAKKRDINQYPNYKSLNNYLLPYTTLNDDDDEDTHTLNHREIKCIENLNNMVKKNDDYDPEIGLAKLLYENDDWVVVRTDDQKANSEFGRYTTWCTSGTRFSSMFDSYASRGNLFVLIKKGKGSKGAIKKEPSARLQFHFEDDQYMDANDMSININEFLFNNEGVKDYFKEHITKVVIPKMMLNTKGHIKVINYLLNLGYGDSMINILKDVKPKELDLSGKRLDNELLKGLGQLTTLEKLDLSDCHISDLPDGISRLNKLKYLKLRGNPISNVPNWLNNFSDINFLDLSNCDISKRLDFTGLNNLTTLILDYNPKMLELPEGLNTLSKLVRLTASNCGIKAIDNDIINCGELCLLDLHSNNKLSKLPSNISAMDNIIAICVDYTNISDKLIEELNSNKRSEDVSIIKYGN